MEWIREKQSCPAETESGLADSAIGDGERLGDIAVTADVINPRSRTIVEKCGSVERAVDRAANLLNDVIGAGVVLPHVVAVDQVDFPLLAGADQQVGMRVLPAASGSTIGPPEPRSRSAELSDA